MTLPAIFASTGSVRPPCFPSGAMFLLLVTVCPAWSAEARTFDRMRLLETKGETSASVSLGDIDRDGDLDLVVGRQEARGSIFFNQSSTKELHFDEVSWGDGQGTVYGVALGDLDGDGWPDIVAARSEAPNAIWFNGPAVKK